MGRKCSSQTSVGPKLKTTVLRALIAAYQCIKYINLHVTLNTSCLGAPLPSACVASPVHLVWPRLETGQYGLERLALFSFGSRILGMFGLSDKTHVLWARAGSLAPLRKHYLHHPSLSLTCYGCPVSKTRGSPLGTCSLTTSATNLQEVGCWGGGKSGRWT